LNSSGFHLATPSFIPIYKNAQTATKTKSHISVSFIHLTIQESTVIQSSFSKLQVQVIIFFSEIQINQSLMLVSHTSLAKVKLKRIKVKNNTIINFINIFIFFLSNSKFI